MNDFTDHVSPLVKNLALMTAQLRILSERASPLMADVRKYFPRDTSSTPTQKLSMSERISGNFLELLKRLDKMPIGDARAQTENLIWTMTKALLLVGAAWSIFWWSGYCLAKRAFLRSAAKIVRSQKKKNHSEPPSKAAA